MEDLRWERKAWYKIASDLFKWGQHALFLTWSFRVFQWDGTSHSRTSILEHSPFPVFAIQLYPSSFLAACLSHHLLLFSRTFQAFQTICFIHIFVFQAFDHWGLNYHWGEEQNTQPSFLGQGQRNPETEAHHRCGQVTCPCFYWNCSSISNWHDLVWTQKSQ